MPVRDGYKEIKIQVPGVDVNAPLDQEEIIEIESNDPPEEIVETFETVEEVVQEESVVTDVTLDDAVPSQINDEKTERENKRRSRAQKRIKEILAEKKEVQAALEKERQLRLSLEKTYVSEVKDSKEDEKTSIEENIKNLLNAQVLAMQNGESEKVAQIQNDLIKQNLRLAAIEHEIKQYSKVEQDQALEENKAPQQNSEIPEKALEWIEEHPAFKTDQLFYVASITVNNQLLSEGFDPDSDDFYEELNDRLAPRFPEVFGDKVLKENMKNKNMVQSSKGGKSNTPQEETDEPSQSQSSSKPTTVQTVSSGTRSQSGSLSPKVQSHGKSDAVTLTGQDLRDARQLGLSPRQMAERIRNIQKNKRPDGYVPIFIDNK